MKKTKKSLKHNKYSLFDIVNTGLVILITLLVMYPLYFCVIASFSDPTEVALGNTLLWIKGFTVQAYELVLEDEQLFVGFRNTIFYTLFGTLYNMLLTIPASYVLSKKYLPGHGLISWFFFITMYVSGGMIPSYLLIRDLGLLNTPWVMIVGSGISVYNMIVARQYFSSSIPEALYEAAAIDGSSEIHCFTHIALPLAKPILAVITLFYAVGHWNNFYNALIYVYNKNLYPLQLVLRNMLIMGQLNLSGLERNVSTEELQYMIERARMAQNMKYSIVIISAIPLLLVYPFVQKHFVKGIMVGSVKG